MGLGKTLKKAVKKVGGAKTLVAAASFGTSAALSTVSKSNRQALVNTYGRFAGGVGTTVGGPAGGAIGTGLAAQASKNVNYDPRRRTPGSSMTNESSASAAASNGGNATITIILAAVAVGALVLMWKR